MDKFTYKAESSTEDKIKDLRAKPTEFIDADVAQRSLYNLRRDDYAAIFKSPKKAREVWRNVALAVALRPAAKPITQLNKDGEETFESRVQKYTYDTLAQDIDKLGDPNGAPTEIEMILGCQAVIARTNPTAFAAFVDRAGGKPVDESKVDAKVANPYQELSDEELEMLVAFREQKAKEQTAQSIDVNCTPEE